MASSSASFRRGNGLSDFLKFVYSHVKAGLRSKDLEDALQWLVSAGLISKVARVTCPMRPLISYEDGAFKLFSLDVGLLCAQAKVKARLLLEGDRIFREFKGALAEQYVQQELRAVEGEVFEPHYWANENWHCSKVSGNEVLI